MEPTMAAEGPQIDADALSDVPAPTTNPTPVDLVERLRRAYLNLTGKHMLRYTGGMGICLCGQWGTTYGTFVSDDEAHTQWFDQHIYNTRQWLILEATLGGS